MNRHMTFVFKQCAQHWYSNNTNRWMTSMSMSLWKSNFTQLLLSNCDPWSLWCEWIIWIILWNALRCCFWFFDWKLIKFFSCIIGGGCLLSLLLFSSCCVVWQHHHSKNYFYVLPKWDFLIFKAHPPPLLRVLSTSRIIL